MSEKVDLARNILAKGDVARALKVLDAAAKDDAEACRVLAELYEDGVRVKGDARRAHRFRVRARDMEKQASARERRAARAFREVRRTFCCPCRLPRSLRLAQALAACEARRQERAFRRQTRRWRPNSQARRRIETASLRILSTFMSGNRDDGRNFSRLVACL